MTELTPALPVEINDEDQQVPWTLRDTWIGFSLFFVLLIGFSITKNFFTKTWMLAVLLLIYQPLQFIPVWIILRLRNASWADLGFKKAVPNVLAIGCGFVILAFGISFVNNIFMVLFHVQVQAEKFFALASDLNNPVVLLITGAVIAPIFEETIFRGFIFSGLRQKYGWKKAALINSALFALCHFQIAAFIPTFTLGFVFSYLRQRSSSIWPGIILHTLVNSFSLCLLVTVLQNSSLVLF